MSKRKCIFSEELQKKYTCFTSTENSKNEAFCTVCRTVVSVANKGKYDLEQHISSFKHKSTISAGQSSKSVCDFFTTKFSALDKRVSAVEGTLAFHTLKHGYSFNSTVCTNKLLCELFHDSQIAKRISCGKTKTTCISNVIAQYSIDNIMQSLKDICFISVSTDGSNHGAVKMFPIVIQFFEIEYGVVTKIINLDSLPNETAETISDYLIKCLKKYNILSKCVAFSADNCNTNFGAVNRSGKNNVHCHLNNKIGKSLIGIGCPAHIVHNSAQHGFDSMPIDLESILLKIYNYFSIYTIRTESLKQFCEFVDIEYRTLLKHSKTRWLSLYTVINRVLQVYPALKAYFLSLDSCPYVLKSFFENIFSEAYLYFAHSLIYVFHEKIKEIEAEQNSVLEVMAILYSLKNTLNERFEESFLPLKVKSFINENIKNGLEQESNVFKLNCINCYKKSLNYLELWTDQFLEFKCFAWMKLDNIPKWDDIEKTIMYLNSKDVAINDVKCFDQFGNLKVFLAKNIEISEFKKSLSCIKWSTFFKTNTNSEFYSEFLKMCQFFYSIPGQNANVERIFSLISGQWTKSRNRLKMSTVKNILTVVYNYKNISCSEFYNEIKFNDKLLNQISSADKYTTEKESESENDD